MVSILKEIRQGQQATSNVQRQHPPSQLELPKHCGPHLTPTTKDGETINLLGGTNNHNAKPIITNNLLTPTTNHKTSKFKIHHTNNHTNHQTNNVTNHLISDKTYQTPLPQSTIKEAP
ncbi:hypothetical protein PIB30_097677 [Stylosanthes scabra]|uniref:Uncharacterized protein n=1 Tax=Stylosanthes scabra TaxID=79078 RepID=A0ABU6VUT0_9FABA|nr:hypothetical protein [Stylosanthes scabra]